MSELVTVTLKMSAELRDRLKDRATAAGTSVSALLIEGVSGEAKPDPRIAELEAENARLLIERNQWRDRAKAIVSAGDAVATKRVRDPDPMQRSHPAGPVYEPRLAVQGTARPMFRRGSNAEKALKGD